MKKIWAAFVAASLAISGAAEAKHMSMDELDLTPEQREKAESIFAKGHQKIEDLRKEEKEIKEKIHRQHEENMAEFEKILTPEQQEKLHQRQKDLKTMKHEKHKIRGMHDVKPDAQKKEPQIRKHRKDMPKGGFVEE